MFELFKSRDKRIKDAQEVKQLFSRHGRDTIAVLENRANDKSVSSRDHRHWKRILRRARRERFKFKID